MSLFVKRVDVAVQTEIGSEFLVANEWRQQLRRNSQEFVVEERDGVERSHVLEKIVGQSPQLSDELQLSNLLCKQFKSNF